MKKIYILRTPLSMTIIWLKCEYDKEEWAVEMRLKHQITCSNFIDGEINSLIIIEWNI